jgi:hypothetical protein
VRKSSAIAAIGLSTWTFVAAGTGTAMIALTPPDQIPSGFRLEDTVKYLSMPVSLSIVGLLIAVRRPGNPIGWALTLAGAASALQFLAAGYAVQALFAPTRLLGGVAAAWVFNWAGSLVGLMLVTLLFAFPDGILPLRRARVGLTLGVVGGLLATALLAFTPGPLRNFPGVENPSSVQLSESAAVALGFLAAITALFALILAVSTLWHRATRSQGAERQQFKWVIGSMVFCGLCFAAGLPIPDRAVSNLADSVALSAVPVAIGVAILRYRLYDIDLLINRTLVYGATSAAIAVTFFIGIVALQTLLRPLTAGSDLAVAASTLVSFALFQPVRRRVQDAVNRRFDRSRYDAARTLDTLANRLRDEVDLESLRAELLRAVRQTMSPSHATLWLRSDLPKKQLGTLRS